MDISTPANWNQFQKEEQMFLDGEADRLLYVATTRAECMLIVSVGKDNSNWSGLHSYLAGAEELSVPAARPSVADELAGGGDDSAADARVDINIIDKWIDKWSAATTPSYMVESVKEISLQGTTRPDWQASGDFGYKWGSAVHELLEIATKTPSVDLRASASLLANQYDLGSERVGELLTTADAVTHSDVWKRSLESKRCFSELPFETLSRSDDGQPMITRGVIDLLFEEDDGWVIVDYKTDDITESDIVSAVNYYRPQLKHYAIHWHETTGNHVAQLGLYFTRINQYVEVG
jgi:ATP-dependent helicase/nuclease subunit A